MTGLFKHATKSKRNHPDSRGRIRGPKLPHFLIIGAAKSGTTTLYRYLTGHPGVFMPKLKEPEFFSTDQLYLNRQKWYLSLFRAAGDDKLCGEASTAYTRWPHTADAAERIYRWVPGVKLIYIMRHPVDRAYSQYAHDMRREVKMTFEQALEATSLYIDSSMYLYQIERYLRWFPRDSFLFLTTDDLRRDPEKVMADLLSFLKLDFAQLVKGHPLKANQGGAEYFVRSRTTERLRKYRLLSVLIDWLPPRWRKSIFRTLERSPVGTRIASNYSLPPMKPETRVRLLKQFNHPNNLLSSFLGRDLSNWNA